MFVFALGLLLSLLTFDIFTMPVPIGGLDPSWAYAVDYLALHHMPFGRDIVYTYGPLAFIASHFFLPDQEVTYRILSAMLVTVIFIGFFVVSDPRMRVFTLLLPIFLANSDISSAVYFVLPLTLVFLAAKSSRVPRVETLVAIGLTMTMSLLPLVKGTMMIPAVLGVGAASYIFVRKKVLIGYALIPLFLATMMVTWTIIGQSSVGIMTYIRRQFYISDGYTDAMSSSGDPMQVYVFIVAGLAVVCMHLLPWRRFGSIEAFVAACILFVSFKAGFVRHDAHALVAASGLAFLGLLTILNRPSRFRIVGAVAAFAAAGWISSAYRPMDLTTIWQRFASTIGETRREMAALTANPRTFRDRFDTAKRAIAQSADLPPTRGLVDLYSFDQTIVLAADRDYYPRPTLQSYSAYTPELAFLNEDHLRSTHAADTIMFRLQPIDNHFPALDDGRSWPELLAYYRFRTFTGSPSSQPFAVLDKAQFSESSTIDPPSSAATAEFDQDIAVPAGFPFVWTSIDIRPTPIGRVVSLLWKLPLISVDVTYTDGKIATFRLIPGMTRGGFLLSPVVTTAREFVALRSTAVDVLSDRRLKSVKLHQESSWVGRWRSTFQIAFSKLHIPPDPGVDAVVLGTFEDGEPVESVPIKGDCYVDRVGSQHIGAEPIIVTGSTVPLSGWAMMSIASGQPSSGLRFAVTPLGGGPTRYAAADRSNRAGVDAFFRIEHPTNSGFTAQINASTLSGPYDVALVQTGPEGPALCPAGRFQIDVRR